MIKVKRLYTEAKMMKKAFEGDAGFDVFCMKDFTIYPRQTETIGLGLATEFEPGNVLQVCDKSGLAVKKGIFTIGGIIDSNYRGEIHVCLANFSSLPVKFEAGQKVAQLILMSCYTGKDIEVVEVMSETDRGEGGFGSTGDC